MIFIISCIYICSYIQTGVWGEVGRVRSKFIQPLRQSLERNKLQCRGEMERQREGDGGIYVTDRVLLLYLVLD